MSGLHNVGLASVKEQSLERFVLFELGQEGLGHDLKTGVIPFSCVEGCNACTPQLLYFRSPVLGNLRVIARVNGDELRNSVRRPKEVRLGLNERLL